MTRRLLLVLAFLLAPAPVAAQSLTTGAIQGVVTDAASGEPLPGVTVVVDSAALQGDRTVITDEAGVYKVTGLPPGTYDVTCYYLELTVSRAGVVVSVNRTIPAHVALDTTAAGGEVITIEARPPAIDPTTTIQGVTLDRDYVTHLPVGRTYEENLGAAAGASHDDAGVSFSGSSSLENQYVIDGVNTTSLLYGQVGTPLINEFIQETEIITGGYNAEHGRSTGGVVNVVTRSGSNEVHGSVFGRINPGFLMASPVSIPTQSASIDSEYDVIYDADAGFEVGGPIVEDRLWFYVGLAPSLEREDLDRVVRRRTDVDGDGAPDVDPSTGFLVMEELDRRTLRARSDAYPLVAKLDVAASPSHQGQVSLLATPASGTALGMNGLPGATHLAYESLTSDVSARWTSRIGDRTELEAVLGWHRATYRETPVFGAMADVPRQNLFYGDLATWAELGGETAAVMAGCSDGPGDPYPSIRNCPDEGVGYAIGGPGSLADGTEERLGARLGATRRFVALGHHEVKAGLDVEDNRLRTRRQTSGDVYYDVMLPQEWAPGEVQVWQWVDLSGDDLDGSCPDSDAGIAHACAPIGPTDVHGETLNWAAYLRDSWQLRPDLTINVGLRYEEQRLRHARARRDMLDPITGEQRGTNAMVLRDMWAPRIGAIYDWTGQGRSKIYAHWGRFYESVPMAINSINFGGETMYRQVYEIGQCGEAVPGVGGPDGPSCVAGGEDPALGSNVFGTGVLVAPGTRAQYLDEAILGVEYALTEDLKVGVAFHDRRLGRVLEDVSPDNTETYILANPGEFPEEEADRLREQIEATSDPEERARLEHLLDVYLGIREFDRPSRVHDALQITAVKRFGGALFLQASYTYARTRGNFPGLYSPDSGAVLPNITAQYDLYELLGNRYGPLPNDRPHDLKVDGYKVWDVRAGQLVTGARYRLASGTPVDALASNSMYGFDESFVLPRGAIGRTGIDTTLDVHLGFGRALGGGVKLELFADVFNVLNRQGTTYVDESYSYDPVNPILGGDGEDVIWAKAQDWDGNEPDAPQPAVRNRNFGNAEVRTPPVSGRLGARISF